MKLSSAVFLIVGLFLVTVAAKNTQTDVVKPSQGSVNDGKIEVHQLCNSGGAKAEVSSLKNEVEMLRKELTQGLEKNGTKVLSARVALLGRKIEKVGKTLKKQLDQIQQKDSWIKLNTAPVCFGARGDQFGKFSVPSGGRLLAIKLVHLHGYVTCDKNKVYHWSYWGCGAHGGVGAGFVDVAITTSTNRILLPPRQFIVHSSGKWSKVPGYDSLSPELVLSVFSSPLTVTSGQVLRLWYGEDLGGSTEHDNDGTSCSDVFARFM